MDVQALQTYCDLIEQRSFSKVAAKHSVSQSAISQQVAKLELVHKCQLIIRQKRPLEVTPAGQLLYDTCREMLGRYEQFREELEKLKHSNGDVINIAAIFSIGMHNLPPYLKKFLSRYPDANLHVEYCNWDQIHARVLSGAVDVGLVAVPKHDKNLEVYDFGSEPLMLVCSPEHPLAEEETARPEALGQHKFIAFAQHVPTRELLDFLLAEHNIVLRPVMEFDNTETIKRAVMINSGISILPRTAIVQEVGAGLLRALPFEDNRFVRPTGILVRKHRALSQPARYLLELLQNRWV